MYTVRQMTSPRTGNPVANQFEIRTPKGVFFQSYKSIIALVDNNNNIILDEYFYDYSRTTSKYLTQFFRLEHTREKKNDKE